MQYELLHTADEVAHFCAQAAEQPAIAVDTEFVRTRTLTPQLGLVQIYDGQRLVLIDPLAVEDLSALVALLTNPDVVKVLHSCSEDLETFNCALGVMPSPIFDSQFAASIANIGPMLGYAKLVEQMLGVNVDKGESRTDWLARPLTEKQLHYAANDVLYLYQLYPTLKQQVESLGRLDWVYTEMAQLCLKKQADIAPEDAYLQYKSAWQLKGQSLAVLRQLAGWRLTEARNRNLALNFVVKEANIIALAKQQPTTRQQLYNVQGLSPQEIRRYGDKLVKQIELAKALPPQDYPRPIKRLVEFPAYKHKAHALRELCQRKAEELSIPVEVLGSKKQINQLLEYLWFERDELSAMDLTPDLLTGWRANLLLGEIDELVDDKLSASSHD